MSVDNVTKQPYFTYYQWRMIWNQSSIGETACGQQSEAFRGTFSSFSSFLPHFYLYMLHCVYHESKSAARAYRHLYFFFFFLFNLKNLFVIRD
ncbi:hypothetical protein BDZ91DRAFT_722764, partial [Kalaharituber pfeilii]